MQQQDSATKRVSPRARTGLAYTVKVRRLKRTQTLHGWADELGIAATTLVARYKVGNRGAYLLRPLRTYEGYKGRPQVVIGQRFGKLEVLARSEERETNGVRKWDVRCDCGVHKAVRNSALKLANLQSCGSDACKVYKNKIEPVQVTYRGETKELGGWSATLKVSAPLLRQRWKDGLRDEALFARTPKVNRKF